MSKIELSEELSYLLSGFPPNNPSVKLGLVPHWPYHMQYPSATDTKVAAATTSSAANDTFEFLIVTCTKNYTTTESALTHASGVTDL